MQRKAIMFGTGLAAGAAAIVWEASIDQIYAIPATLVMMFVCVRWGAGRERRPMPEAWFEPRNH